MFLTRIIARCVETFLEVKGTEFILKIPTLSWAEKIDVESYRFQSGFLVIEGRCVVREVSGRALPRCDTSCNDREMKDT
jgi:hypothetical protein